MSTQERNGSDVEGRGEERGSYLRFVKHIEERMSPHRPSDHIVNKRERECVCVKRVPLRTTVKGVFWSRLTVVPLAFTVMTLPGAGAGVAQATAMAAQKRAIPRRDFMFFEAILRRGRRSERDRLGQPRGIAHVVLLVVPKTPMPHYTWT